MWHRLIYSWHQEHWPCRKLPLYAHEGGIAEIHVTNPVATSVYQWSTTNGNIISNPATGPSIYVDGPGIYIVRQYLQAGCSVYATDTVEVLPITNCQILDKNFVDFRGELSDDIMQLSWTVLNNQQVQYFEVQRSEDGVNFVTIDKVNRRFLESTSASYSYNDNVSSLYNTFIHYRIKLVNINMVINYSNIISIRLSGAEETKVNIVPNPVRDMMQLQILSKSSSTIRLVIFDQSGKLISSRKFEQKGRSVIALNDLVNQRQGVYFALIYIGDKIFRQKLLLSR